MVSPLAELGQREQFFVGGHIVTAKVGHNFDGREEIAPIGVATDTDLEGFGVGKQYFTLGSDTVGDGREDLEKLVPEPTHERT